MCQRATGVFTLMNMSLKSVNLSTIKSGKVISLYVTNKTTAENMGKIKVK